MGCWYQQELSGNEKRVKEKVVVFAQDVMRDFVRKG